MHTRVMGDGKAVRLDTSKTGGRVLGVSNRGLGETVGGPVPPRRSET